MTATLAAPPAPAAAARPPAPLVAVAVLAAPLTVPLARGATPALLVGLALAPLWLPRLLSGRSGRALAASAAVAGASGLALPLLTGTPRSSAVALETGLLTAGALCAAGVVAWARTALPLRVVTALLGAGLVLLGLTALPAPEPWKTALGPGTALLLLSAVPRRAGPVVGVVSLLALAGLDIALGSRAAFALALLAAALTAWSGLPERPAPPLAVLRAGVALVALTAALGWLGTWALLDGKLGREVQQRSQEQVQTSGNLLLGGRPEWAATLALAREQPAGYGLGVVPRGDDVRRARKALAGVGLDPDPARDRYMFGGSFRLHSVAADLWAAYGPGGALLALVLAALLLRGLARGLVDRAAHPVVVLALVTALWHLAFGTLFSNLVQVALAVGLVVPVAGARSWR